MERLSVRIGDPTAPSTYIGTNRSINNEAPHRSAVAAAPCEDCIKLNSHALDQLFTLVDSEIT